MSTIDSIFVYGTLKRSHLRSTLWPCQPISIQSATIRAALYDTGPFPAILSGDDRVLGELWKINLDDLPRTLAVLDDVEGFDATRANNLYVRIETEATLEDRSQVRAYAYQFASAEKLDSMRRIEPLARFDGQLCVAWPDSLSRVPMSLADE